LNLIYFLGNTLKNNNSLNSNISSRIIKVAILALTLSVTAIIISVVAGKGLQEEIGKKVYAFNGNLIISTFDNNNSQFSSNPFEFENKEESVLKNLNDVSSFQRIAYKGGLIRNKANFEGIIFKGVDPKTYINSNFNDFIVEGRFINTSTKKKKEILISKTLSRKLDVSIDEKVVIYFKKNNYQAIPSQRKFIIVGIYDSGFFDFDDIYIFGDISQVQSINSWSKDQVGGVEVYINDKKKDNFLAKKLYDLLPSNLDVITIRSKYENIFQWISLFDFNIYIILVIMTLVGVVNVATALMILIFEKTQMIGILKTIGATDFLIQKVFLWNGFQIITKGLIYGNILGLGFYFSQNYFKWIKLDPITYYINYAPVKLDFFDWIFVNLFMAFICLFLLWFPTKIINRFSPSENIRY
tara:strand:- start:4130 stop:5365 length:1236 start_codon:yes stop_codon:yes gene_type:complete